jgi:uncharacterized membrane protein
MTQANNKFFLRRIQAIALALVILGTIFRFTNLGQKNYWIDEVFTSLRLSGYTEEEVIQEAFQGQILSRDNLLKYQQINRDRPFKFTLKSLALENAHHPPFYYFFVRTWVQFFGDSIAVTRSFSAFASLLTFPVIYLLSVELFKAPIVGYFAVVLTAISPLHLIYAQEARSYSLWILEIFLSSWLLLRALRLKNYRSWLLYSLSTIAGFYTFIFHFFVWIGQSIYVFRRTCNQEKQNLNYYLISTTFSIFAFSPWIIIIIQNLTTVRERTGGLKQEDQLVQKWLANMSDLFFDLDQGSRYLRIYHLLAWLLVIYAFYWLSKQKKIEFQKATWFLMSLSGTTAISLISFDLIFHNFVSVYERYMFPSYLGAGLAVAFLLADKSINASQKTIWRLFAIALIIGGIWSCGLNIRASQWWNKNPHQNRYNSEIAEIVNHSEQPLLISDDSTALGGCFICRILSLNYLLSDRVNFLLVKQPNIPNIPNNYDEVFIFSPTEQLVISLQKKYKLNLIFDRDNFQLYKISDRPLSVSRSQFPTKSNRHPKALTG